MGVDALIYVEKTTGDATPLPPIPYPYQQTNDGPHGSTHYVAMGAPRYYATDYERGWWPEILAVLVTLHAAPAVGRVWYGPDTMGDSDIPLCGPDRVLSITRHWMEVGNRPYRERAGLVAAPWEALPPPTGGDVSEDLTAICERHGIDASPCFNGVRADIVRGNDRVEVEADTLDAAVVVLLKAHYGIETGARRSVGCVIVHDAAALHSGRMVKVAGRSTELAAVVALADRLKNQLPEAT